MTRIDRFTPTVFVGRAIRIVLLELVTVIVAVAQPSLFRVATAAELHKSVNTTRCLATVAAKPWTKGVVVVSLDATALDSTKVQLALDCTTQVAVERKHLYTESLMLTPDAVLWNARGVPGGGRCDVDLIRKGNSLMGSVVLGMGSGSRSFEIWPLGEDGLHIVCELDLSKMPKTL